MPAVDPTDLMQQVYGFFRHLYPSTTPDAFLVFEHLGLPINPADYQLNGVPCPPLALELTSRMCNQPLIFTEGSAYHSTQTVDGMMSFMLNSSSPVTADDAQSLGAAKIKGATSLEITLGSLSGIPNDEFHPVISSPVSWYDPSQNANWTPYSLGQQAAATPTPPTPPIPFHPIVWRLPPPVHTASPIPIRPGFPPDPIGRRPMVMMAAKPSAVLVGAPAAAAVAAPAPAMASAAAIHLSPMLVQHQQQNSAIMSNPQLRNLVLAQAPVRINNLQATLQNSAPPAAGASVATQPVASNSISMSFDYCVVSLTWPWLPQEFLLSRNWFLHGYTKGLISDASGASDENGLFPVLPSGFLVVRNLTISAQWSQTDVQAIQAGAGFGPFRLNGSQFQASSGKLTIPGMQIIGWFCSAMQVLPPADAPH